MQITRLAGLALVAGCSTALPNGNDCGSGTHLANDGTCVVDVVCGMGTRQIGGVCVPDGTKPVPDGGSDVPDLGGDVARSR